MKIFTAPTREQLVDRTAVTVIRRYEQKAVGHTDAFVLDRWGQLARPLAEFTLFSVGEIIRPELDRLYRRAS